VSASLPSTVAQLGNVMRTESGTRSLSELTTGVGLKSGMHPKLPSPIGPAGAANAGPMLAPESVIPSSSLCTLATIPWPSDSACARLRAGVVRGDRKSTRLNSSHVAISYAVFCLKKKIQKVREHL